ncbi:hypothetical protein M231_05780 [Tremella mesenterica]|uniref:Uncharacterized protein n=1 Tax=Tremella mesenterica TaxID=5217 RepID=A0A4V1M3I1_TREME|nr:hypothetical protein M231_05780 [Tremella mesenterica]
MALVLGHSADRADHWPYDLDYVAVPIPRNGWSNGQKGAWYFLQALNAGLSNLTHIQFLTLLFPSRLETRLIFCVLGPLAISASALTFTALAPSRTVFDLGDAVRNVFNSTLLLIFTIALAIWGFFVNRRRAWRFDGGTAIFGFGALFLAVVTTVCNFVAIKEDGIDWLQHLLFAGVLWQTWLGWWWWVGSGMGIGEVEDLMERAERKKRQRAKRAAKQRSSQRAHPPQPIHNSITTGISQFTSILRRRTSSLLRQQPPQPHVDPPIELADLSSSPQRVTFSPASTSVDRGVFSSVSDTSTSGTPSLHTPRNMGELLSFPIRWIYVYSRRLRRAHEEAAKREALAHAEIRQRVFSHTPQADETGWGLGQFGIREREESTRRLRRAGDLLREDRLLSPGGVNEEVEALDGAEFTERAMHASGTEQDVGEGKQSIVAGERRNTRRRIGNGGEEQIGGTRDRDGQGEVRDTEEEWEDITSSDNSQPVPPPARQRRRPEGWSWWGPLRDWRLNDRSVF